MGPEGQGLTQEDINKIADETIENNTVSGENVQGVMDLVKDDFNTEVSNISEADVFELPKEVSSEERASSYKVLENGGPVDELKNLRINEARIGQMKRDLRGGERDKDQVA